MKKGYDNYINRSYKVCKECFEEIELLRNEIMELLPLYNFAYNLIFQRIT